MVLDRLNGRLHPLPLPGGRDPVRLSLAPDARRLALQVADQGQWRVEVLDLSELLEPDPPPGPTDHTNPGGASMRPHSPADAAARRGPGMCRAAPQTDSRTQRAAAPEHQQPTRTVAGQRWLASLSQRGGRERVELVDLSSRRPVPLPGLNRADAQPISVSVSADGERLAVVQQRDARTELVLYRRSVGSRATAPA